MWHLACKLLRDDCPNHAWFYSHSTSFKSLHLIIFINIVIVYDDILQALRFWGIPLLMHVRKRNHYVVYLDLLL